MKENKKPRYRYDNVTCKKVVDGDTIDVIIDLGFGIKKKERLRLYRINAPEIRGKEREKGLEAKEYVEEKLFDFGFSRNEKRLKVGEFAKTFRIETFKEGKYGRMLANIQIIGYGCLNDNLVKEGHAVYKKYG